LAGILTDRNLAFVVWSSEDDDDVKLDPEEEEENPDSDSDPEVELPLSLEEVNESLLVELPLSEEL